MFGFSSRPAPPAWPPEEVGEDGRHPAVFAILPPERAGTRRHGHVAARRPICDLRGELFDGQLTWWPFLAENCCGGQVCNLSCTTEAGKVLASTSPSFRPRFFARFGQIPCHRAPGARAGTRRPAGAYPAAVWLAARPLVLTAGRRGAARLLQFFQARNTASSTRPDLPLPDQVQSDDHPGRQGAARPVRVVRGTSLVQPGTPRSDFARS